jgi:hypothetical protein
MEHSPFDREHKAILDSLLLGTPGVVAGKMLGYPAYDVCKKLFACVYGHGVGIKVPERLATELVQTHYIASDRHCERLIGAWQSRSV